MASEDLGDGEGVTLRMDNDHGRVRGTNFLLIDPRSLDQVRADHSTMLIVLTRESTAGSVMGSVIGSVMGSVIGSVMFSPGRVRRDQIC